jgi:hypothetical protein
MICAQITEAQRLAPKWDSFHCAITGDMLKPYLDKWEALLGSLR